MSVALAQRAQLEAAGAIVREVETVTAVRAKLLDLKRIRLSLLWHEIVSWSCFKIYESKYYLLIMIM